MGKLPPESELEPGQHSPIGPRMLRLRIAAIATGGGVVAVRAGWVFDSRQLGYGAASPGTI